MGGSTTLAADPNYRRVVHLTAALTQRGYLVVGGGGLGIMEAANLGAYLAERSDAERDARRGRARRRAAVARGPGRLHAASRTTSARASRRAARAWRSPRG